MQNIRTETEKLVQGKLENRVGEWWNFYEGKVIWIVPVVADILSVDPSQCDKT